MKTDLHKILLLALIVLAFIQPPGYCQIPFTQKFFTDRQEIIFNSEGQMVSYPSIFVTKHTRPAFKVQVPIANIVGDLEKMRQHLDSALKYFSDPEIAGAYKCIFGSDNFNALIKAYQETSDSFQLSEDCQKISVHQLKIASCLLGVDDLVPITKYLTGIEEQYKVEVYRGNLLIKTITLRPIENQCKNGCISFEASTNEKLSELDNSLCLFSPTDEFHFKLIQDNAWNATLRDWYKNQILKLSKKEIEEIKKGLKIVAETDSQANPSEYDAGITKILQLSDWFRSWLWLTNGKLTLDPFDQMTVKKRKDIETQLTQAGYVLDQLNQQVKFLDSARIKVDEKLLSLADFQAVQAKELELKTTIKNAGITKDALKTILDEQAKVKSIREIKVQYEGRLKISTGNLFKSIEGINPHKQFDANTGYQKVKSAFFQQVRVNEIPEGQKLYVLLHNIPSGQGIRMDERILPFKDNELFTTFVSEQLAQLDFSSIAAAAITSLQDFTGSFAKSGGSTPKGLNTDPKNCLFVQKLIKPLFKQLTEEQSTFPGSYDLVSKLTRTEPRYVTKLLPTAIENGEAVLDSLTLKRFSLSDSLKTTTIVKTSVKVGKLRYFIVTAGISIHATPLTTTNIDTTGGGFRTSTSENRSRAIMGFKFYPLKNYNRDHSIMPRFPLRRLSIFLGVEMLKPLNNLYLGGAYDIVPGLNFSVGNNYALQTRYNIQNNRVTDTSRSYKRTGLYYAVGVNPVLFVQFIKLFFK